jgi:heme-degrading monooxygenase HmoA
MTFTTDSTHFDELVYSLKTQLSQVYENLPGFVELLAVHHAGTGHVIAITLWTDRESADAAEKLTHTVADRIARVVGEAASHNIYDVIGRLTAG